MVQLHSIQLVQFNGEVCYNYTLSIVIVICVLMYSIYTSKHLLFNVFCVDRYYACFYVFIPCYKDTICFVSVTCFSYVFYVTSLYRTFVDLCVKNFI